MSRERILLVDDEEDILNLVKYNLERDGYKVETVTTGEAAVRAARENVPDLILLDLMLPGMDGFDVCRILKNDKNVMKTPIVMLTAKGEDSDIVAGLELGADDYITKPFSPRVLIARVKAVLRRDSKVKEGKSPLIKVDEMEIDTVRHRVAVSGESIDLTATEFDILVYLARRPGWVFTRSQIINGVKGDDYPVTDRSVDVQILNLRKKLGDAGVNIETVRGVGYRFKDQQ
ncbi:MAG TPA: response regulator transcription factor [bacterium]|jgi:two-component system phosphate regulon response regulator PhoB|nr:response regulator transcription factor [bacterium]HPA57659.1 response regulator transcription factor [bacterium]HPV21220.1 response regulator transcription factor [bacterium]HPY15765.1 response regulator transcription factor [bacterium]HQJ60417.1 response regulator transcription factor [bacterium]